MRDIFPAGNVPEFVGQRAKLVAINDIAGKENIARRIAIAEQRAFFVIQRFRGNAKDYGLHSALLVDGLVYTQRGLNQLTTTLHACPALRKLVHSVRAASRELAAARRR